MNNLINHTELALNIKNGNVEKANAIYIHKIDLLLSLSSNPNEFKKLLYSINIFTYTYFCINHSMPLENLCSKNLMSIDTCYLKDDLILLGKKIIKSYMDVNNNNNNNGKLENEIIKQALTYIHSNIQKKITLEKVAANIHISSNYLCYLFKENTGFKFCQYINICRINAAKGFLDNSSYNLDIISFKSGFNSQSHFCTTFKKYVGVSPNEYRKRSLNPIINLTT